MELGLPVPSKPGGYFKERGREDILLGGGPKGLELGLPVPPKPEEHSTERGARSSLAWWGAQEKESALRGEGDLGSRVPSGTMTLLGGIP